MTSRTAGRAAASPARATLLLGAGLALLAAALTAVGPSEPLLAATDKGPPGWLAAGLAVGFCLAELCLLHVEVRREAYSITLAGVPLLLGVLLCGARELVAARLLGSAAAFAVQRAPRLKAGYNLAAYAFEAALAVLAVHLLLPATDGLVWQVAVGAYLVVAAGDQLMSALVVRVIGWHQGRLSVRQAAEIHLPALACSVLATTGGYALLLLTGRGPVGAIVLVVFVGGAAAVYRSFRTLHRRHQALEHVHRFVALHRGTDTVQEMAGRMLGQVRTLMRAETAELLMVEPSGALQLTSSEHDGTRLTQSTTLPTDWLIDRVRANRSPALLRRGARDRDERRWLAARRVADAIVVPLPVESGDGAVLITGRLGDTGSFTSEDQALLTTLAGHLSVAVRSSTLLDRLRYEAAHDVLTGLANRSLLREALRERLAGADRDRTAVLLLDLDRFKEVNDTLGHPVGDALLCAVAGRIGAVLPAEATVARLGGDEFAALLALPAGGTAGAQHAVALAGELARALAAPVQLPEATVTAQASIGVALPAHASTDSDLLRHADTAMYAAKDTAAGVVLYTAELDRGRAERLALLADLHLALERDELELRYQAKLDLATDRVTSTEALVRWQHPRLGLIGPDAFIPLAEANGLIAPLTGKVLREALRQCAAWQADGLDLTVAVNLSARMVNDPGLPEAISAALLAAGVPASRLILEITESSVMDDPDRAVGTLRRIAAIGVTLSLDDFGTGYSSLSYLQRLPVQEVKIDRSFVTGLLTDDGSSQVLVRSIINLASSLGHRVVAEGVEDAATVDLLRRFGCQLAQGYHISRPVPPEQLAACFHAHPGRPPQLVALAG